MTVHDGQDWNRIYRALAHEGRRALVNYVRTRGDARIEDVPHVLYSGDQSPSGEEVDSVLFRLYHVHFPVLSEAGLLVWDARRARIVPTVLASRLPRELLSPSDVGVSGYARMESVTE
jgi:hypothetical protein